MALSKLDPLLLDFFTGYSDPQIHTFGDSAYAFVAMKPGYDASSINGLMSKAYVIGSKTAPTYVYGRTSRSSLLSLGGKPSVSHVYADVRLGFDQMKPDPDVYNQGLATDMYRVRQILGADRVNQLGVTGKGVTIAIVDTGTDFSIPDLQQAVARDSSGRAVSFDPDGQGFSLTSLVVQRVGDVLLTKGMSVSVYDASSYTQTSSAIPQFDTVTIQNNYGAPTVASKSGNYHFGILRETLQDTISSKTVTIDFPVVVVDSTAAGVYDTVFVDMSTAYYTFLKKYQSRLNAAATDSLRIGLKWPNPNPIWNDSSFADETPHRINGTDMINFNPDAGSAPSFTAGMLSFGIDLSGATGRYYKLLPPIDPKGNFINALFDYESHGTSTASNAASRGILKRDIYQNGTLITLSGIAPDAKIMGIKALWLGDVTFAWYYAAGFDWNDDGSFTYTGNHRAEVISNSWGDSNTILDSGSTFGSDYESQLADAFALPYFLDPSYPGTVMVIAAGNGGFGYGTTTSPGASTLAITVGASTSYAYRVEPALTIKHEVAGSHDEVVPWSGRGPTAIGEPKPDVVDVGAFGFADQSTYTGYGNGTKAYTIFGGTSMATPVTAGAIALLLQEYRDTHNGSTPTPGLVKSILQSTTENLGYDPFTQGAGRVDTVQAVAAAGEGRDSRLQSRFYVQSNATWNSARQIIGDTWALVIGSPLPATEASSANWFAGVLAPGNLASATFSLTQATAPSAHPLQFQLTRTRAYQNSTAGNVTWVTLQKSDIPLGTDLMKATLVYHFSDFANISSWDTKDILYAQLYNVRSDGSLERINNVAPESTTSELTVSKPLDKFSGTPRVRVVLQSGNRTIPFEVVVSYYKAVPWSWVTNLGVKGNRLTASLTVPDSAPPGVYGGFIEVDDGSASTLIPVSVSVPISHAGTFVSATSDSPYSNYAVYGAFDWSARYESGDWRTFAVVIPAGASRMQVAIRWSDKDTDIQAHLTSPTGFLVASSEFPKTMNIGAGQFIWSTSTGGPEEDIIATDLTPGTYLLVLHNTLFGGNSFAVYPERFNVTITFR